MKKTLTLILLSLTLTAAIFYACTKESDVQPATTEQTLKVASTTCYDAVNDDPMPAVPIKAVFVLSSNNKQLDVTFDTAMSTSKHTYVGSYLIVDNTPYVMKGQKQCYQVPNSLYGTFRHWTPIFSDVNGTPQWTQITNKGHMVFYGGPNIENLQNITYTGYIVSAFNNPANKKENQISQPFIFVGPNH